jgi:Restriction endonuclease
VSEILIEVCCEGYDSNTDKGNLFEKFSKRFLETQGLKVTRQVRKTGMEIDLYCQETATGETILVECKAYRSAIAAEVITKLLGSVSLHDYSSGWLISTYALGKDAKGIQDEWSSKPEEKRRRLRIYPPEILVDRRQTDQNPGSRDAIRRIHRRSCVRPRAHLLAFADRHITRSAWSSCSALGHCRKT